MIDLCTVVFEQELPILKLQAQSVALYCRNLGIRNIYIVVNDNNAVAKQIDPAWWGEFAPHVMILPRTIFSAPWSTNGWLSQQLFKLLVPAMSYNSCTMVLDAKTIFIKPVGIKELVNQDGKFSTGQLDIYPVFEPAKQIVDALYNIDLQKQVGPGGVPFVFHNDTVRTMIAETTLITKQNFPEWFQAQGTLTEFILYSGYVQYKYGSLDVMYSADAATIHPVNMCHSEVDSADRKLAEMQSASTVSIHRNAWSKLSAGQQQQYRNILIDHGILDAWALN